jgi:hypothetical protein
VYNEFIDFSGILLHVSAYEKPSSGRYTLNISCTYKFTAAEQITLQIFQSEIILPCAALIIYHAKNISNK